jgi:hypothetical protein
VPVAQEAWQVGVDGVVEAEDIAVGEHERQRGDERLRDAADAEANVRARLAAGEFDRFVPVADAHERPGHACRDDRVERPAELALVVVAARKPHRGRGNECHRHEGSDRESTHVPTL